MRKIFIDPPSKAFYKNRFFTDSELNRDHCLQPYITWKKEMFKQGVDVNTFDLWNQKSDMDYYSFGILNHLDALQAHPNVNMKAFYIFEPPIVDPSIYQALPKLTAIFDEVYIHNTHGDGYSLHDVDQSKLKKLYWPQPFNHVLEPYWSNIERKSKVVVINGNHRPASRKNELYSKRIEAMADLAKYDMVDLYGRGWDRWYSRSSMWMPYWKNRNMLMSIYKGSCKSKYEALSQYEFCLCFENMSMDGYMTEKLFDCLYAGCIPIYWGAPDVTDYINPDVFIDVRSFQCWDTLQDYLSSLSSVEIQKIRSKGKSFLSGGGMSIFYNSLLEHIAYDKV